MFVLFFKVLFTEFIAEMGDKTQLMLIGLTGRYKLKDIIIGTAAAILVLNGLAVLAGGLISSVVPMWLVKIVAALAFLFFAVTSLKKDSGEEEEVKKNRIGIAPLAVAFTFFLAELGDKTQLTAIAFGASEGLGAALFVWLGCSVGLFAADILGMLAGYLLKKKIPERAMNILAFIIFSFFGVYTIWQGFTLTARSHPSFEGMILPLTAAAAAVFAAVCAVVIVKNRKTDR